GPDHRLQLPDQGAPASRRRTAWPRVQPDPGGRAERGGQARRRPAAPNARRVEPARPAPGPAAVTGRKPTAGGARPDPADGHEWLPPPGGGNLRPGARGRG